MEQIIPSGFIVISCSRRLWFSHCQVLDFILSSFSLLQNSLSHLCSSSFSFHISTPCTVFLKLLFWPLLTGFPPPDCSLLSIPKLLFTNYLVFYLSFEFFSYSNIFLPIQHKSCCFARSFISRRLSGELLFLQQEEVQPEVLDIPLNLAFLVFKMPGQFRALWSLRCYIFDIWS